MTLLSTWQRSFTSLIERPQAVLGMTIGLIVIALVGAAIAAAPLLDTVSSQPDPSYGPTAFDQPLLTDLSWRDPSWLTGLGMSWSFAGLATLLLFALGDAVLIRAAAGPWPGARAAWGDAVRCAPALLTISAVSLLYLALCNATLQVALGSVLQGWGKRVESETAGIWWWVLPEVLFVIAALPGKLAADLARASIGAQGTRFGLRALGRGIRGVASSWRPWAIRGVGLMLEAAVIGTFVATRSLWDARTAVSAGLALGAALLLIGLRLFVHAGYLGSLARWQRGN